MPITVEHRVTFKKHLGKRPAQAGHDFHSISPGFRYSHAPPSLVYLQQPQRINPVPV